MAIKIVEESAVLSLDFWEEDVIYCGRSFPVGTLACHALNIPTEVVAQMTTICGNLNHFMGTFNSGKGDETLLPQARQSAMQLILISRNCSGLYRTLPSFANVLRMWLFSSSSY